MQIASKCALVTRHHVQHTASANAMVGIGTLKQEVPLVFHGTRLTNAADAEVLRGTCT